MDDPLQEVAIEELSFDRFESLLERPRWEEVALAAARAAGVLEGRRVWNVNSTARGGGVAEMLRSLLGYAIGVGVDARWLTISADEAFYRLTKRLHNNLHGADRNGGPPGEEERPRYEEALAPAAAALLELVEPTDLVILHDPQTAGLIPAARKRGAYVAWRSHVGHDAPNENSWQAWRFLLPYVRQADVSIFSRRQYYWGGLGDEQVEFIHPSIDAFSAKNRDLSGEQVVSILAAAGILGGVRLPAQGDDTESGIAVRRAARMIEDRRLDLDTPVVLQVSRWDHLKDPDGVLAGFARHVSSDAHLVLAGPDVDAVQDDPEGAEVLREVADRREGLDASVRERVHLVTLPMDDTGENALMVNALQRHATIVVQKSLAEGFGLTVAEAMWKARPVVASRVGGIQDQIEHEVDGLLVDDPRDLETFGGYVGSLLSSPDTASRVGGNARQRAIADFLGPDHLLRYLAMFERLLSRSPVAASGR